MEQNKNWIFILVSSIIFAGVFLFVGLAVTSSLKNNQQTSQGITNTISVVGEGKANVAPDTLEIHTSVSELKPTTKEAQDSANKKIAALQQMLKDLKVPAESLQTTNVSVNPEYDWTNNARKLLGYRSQQSVTIKVSGTDFVTIGGQVIDKIASIGEVQVDSTFFTVKDQIKAMESARQKAFDNAKAKAEQLAKVGGVTLGKPVMISDNGVQYTPVPYYRNGMMKAEMAVSDASAGSTAPLSAGESEVQMTVNVVYEIK